MRVVLRRFRSGDFFRAVDDWTRSPAKAFDFGEKDRAIQKARELGLRDVDVVVVQDDGNLLFGRKLTEAELGLEAEHTPAAAPEPGPASSSDSERAASDGPESEKQKEALTILVAEDLESDAQLLGMAFKRAGVTVPIHFVRDGTEAIDYLGGDGRGSGRSRNPVPTIFLLDLKMPRVDGFEVLEWVRRQSGLKRLVVIVLTASELKADVNRAYDLGANSYLVKPNGFDVLEGIARSLGQYWLDCNRSPDCHPAVS